MAAWKGGGRGRLPITTYTGGEALPKRILLLTWTTSRNQWKERLKIRKIAKSKSDLLKTNEDIAPQCRQITDVCMVGAGHKLALPPPHPQHTNVCQFWQLYRAISLHA